MVEKSQDEGLAWQVGVWNRMAPVYQQEIDQRFGPVVEAVLDRADLRPWQAVLDLGTGTGAVAFAAASQVGAGGRVTAVDISPEMLATARAGAEARALTNIDFAEGRGEAIPVPSHSQDAVLASLSLMYVIDRAATAKEVARVLRSSGRFVGAVWAGADQADIVQFQQLAGSFAPKPPVEGVGPGALIGIAVIQVDESFFDVTVYPLIQGYKFGCLGGGGDGGTLSGNGSSRAGSGSGSGAGGGGGSRRGEGGT